MSLSFEEAPKAGSSRQLPSEGTHAARLVQVIDLGVQDRPAYQGEEKPPAHQLYLTFEITDECGEFNGEERPFWVARIVNYSNDERSTLRKYKDAINPKAKGVEDLLDQPCTVTIKHKEAKGKSFANISSVNPVVKGLSVSELQNPTRVVTMDTDDVDTFNELPKFIKEMMQRSHSWKNSVLGKAVEANPVEEEEEAPF